MKRKKVTPKVPVYDLSEVMPKPGNKGEAVKAVASLLARADQLRAERRATNTNRQTYPGQAKLKQLAHTYRRIAQRFGLSDQLPEFHQKALKATEKAS